MSMLAVGHKRTGACPTFGRPVLQRDGYLLRVPLVGGALTAAQAVAIADISGSLGNGIIELTNRGNLQVRGLRTEALDAALASLRELGLGSGAAALVTISPFAGSAEQALRHELVANLGDALADGSMLSPKFVAHVDDAAQTTSGRRAEASLCLVDGLCRIRIAQLGEAETTLALAVRTVAALADACRSVADDARVADVIDERGFVWLHAVLPVDLEVWTDAGPARTAAPVAGPYVAPGGESFVLAGARFGRIDARSLAQLVALRSDLRVTPWRSIAVAVPTADDVAEGSLLDRLACLGMIVDPADAAAGVVSCIGAAGCWQTEADTLTEAERFVAEQEAGAAAVPGIVHVSGCDKRCATREPVGVTLLGRPDGSGFDEVRTA